MNVTTNEPQCQKGNIFYMAKLSATLCFILYCFSTFKALSQLSIKGIYISKKDFCSSSFLFLPGGLFYYEGGCEDRSYILKGGYKVSKDSIRLIADPSSILRYNIKTTDATPGSKRALYIIDNEGQPLSYFKVFTLSSTVNGDTLNYIKSLQADSNGMLLLDPLQTAFISFDRFNPNRLSKNNHFIWESLAAIAGNAFTVQFNYPGFCLKYPEIKVAAGLPSLKRQKDDDTLIDHQHNIYTKTKN